MIVSILVQFKEGTCKSPVPAHTKYPRLAQTADNIDNWLSSLLLLVWVEGRDMIHFNGPPEK